MPKGIYKRKKNVNYGRPRKEKKLLGEILVTNESTIDLIISMLKQIKGNKIGKVV